MAFKALGLSSAFKLPKRLQVDEYGVRRAGQFVAYGVETRKAAHLLGNRAAHVDTWVTNIRSGMTFEHPLVNSGWYGGNPFVVGQDVLRDEVEQLPGKACGSSSSDDCFVWRLYAEPVTRSAPRLLATSVAPGSQSLAPVICSDGHRALWVEGTPGGPYRAELWNPGAGAPTMVAVAKTPMYPSLVGGSLYVSRVTGRHGGLTAYRLENPVTRHLIGTFRSGIAPIVGMREILYYPGQARRARWRIASMASGASRDRSVGRVIDAPYSAVWVSRGSFIQWTDESFSLVSIGRKRPNWLASSFAHVSVPRVEGKYTGVGVNSSHGASFIESGVVSE